MINYMQLEITDSEFFMRIRYWRHFILCFAALTMKFTVPYNIFMVLEFRECLQYLMFQDEQKFLPFFPLIFSPLALFTVI